MTSIFALIAFLHQALKMFFFLNDELKVDPAETLIRIHQAFANLRKAATPKEHFDAAKAIQEIIRRR